MINKDIFTGLFFGGIAAMILMAVLDIWNHMSLAPMIFILVLDGVLLVDILLDKYTSNKKGKKKK